MRINKGGRNLRIPKRNTDDFSPMESVANLVDVMLVFACGLLIALAAAGRADLGNTPKKIQDVTGTGIEEEIETGALQEMGKVYIDPDTGEMYVVEDE